MLRKNFMNGLIALIAVGALLTAYNAFFADMEDGHSATNHIAEYLNLDVAVQEQPEAPDDQVTVDEGTADEPGAVVTPAPAQEAAPEEQPTAQQEPAKEQTVAPVVVAGDKAETVYTVKEGDTYGCIAEKYYGSFEHWVDVANVNPRSEGFTEYELHVGARIVLPAVSGAALKPASTLCS